jgi:hypothetical protein
VRIGPAVENRHDARVVLFADQPPEALLQLDQHFRHDEF